MDAVVGVVMVNRLYKLVQHGGIGGRAEEGGLGGQCGREELVGGGGLVGPPPWSSR